MKKESEKKDIFCWNEIFRYSLPFLILSIMRLIAFGRAEYYYDTWYQMQQAFGFIPYNNIHPMAHTLLLKLFSLGTQSILIATSLCVWVQILSFSALLGVSFVFLEKQGVPRKWLFPISLLYSISHRNLSYIGAIWKDTPYTICIFALIFCIFVCERKGMVRKKHAVLMGILIAAIALFRHNGILVAVGMLVILAITYRKAAANVLIMVAMSIAVYGGVWLVSNVGLKAEKSTVDHVTYAFSKPIMAVIAQDGDISPEQLAFINDNIVPIDVIKQRYEPYSYTNFIWASEGLKEELYPDEEPDGVGANYLEFFMERSNSHSSEIRAMFWDLLPNNTWIMVKDMVQTRRFIYAIWVDSSKDDPAIFYNFSGVFEHGFYLIATIAIMCIIVRKHKGRRLTYIAMFAPVLINVASVAIVLTPEVRYVWPTFMMFPLYLGMLLVSHINIGRDAVQ